MRNRRLLGWMLCALVGLAGCASAPREVIVLYPDPPVEPKIAYLRSYSGSSDFRLPTFFDQIFGESVEEGFQKPYGVYAYQDKIYVPLTGHGDVAVLDTKARAMSYIGYDGEGKLRQPIGVAVTAGTVFVADSALRRVMGYNAGGELTITIGDNREFQKPVGLAVNHSLSRLYVADSYGHKIIAFNPEGKLLFEFGKRGNRAGEFNYPTNLAVDQRNGSVYIVDTQNFRVQVFDKDGKYLREFGRLGDQPGTFSRPKGIGIDSEGHVYVADAAFANIQVFSETGEMLLFFGSAGMGPGQFRLPAGLCVDEQDRIYVSDSLNSRVQVFQYLSEKWKKENPEQYQKYLQQSETGKKRKAKAAGVQ